MNEYNVTLQYPRASKQAAYSENIQGRTQSEAKMIATNSAKAQGWKGSPVKAEAVIVRRVAA